MRILALVLLAFSSYSVYAVDSCSILNPIEISAALRGPGVVVSFRGKPTAEDSSVCRYARISKAGTFEEFFRDQRLWYDAIGAYAGRLRQNASLKYATYLPGTNPKAPSDSANG